MGMLLRRHSERFEQPAEVKPRVESVSEESKETEEQMPKKRGRKKAEAEQEVGVCNG